MSGHRTESMQRFVSAVYYDKIIAHEQRPVIELHVMVGAKTEEVVQDIRTSPSKGQYVRGFRVWTRYSLESNGADLALKAMEGFDLDRERGIANQSVVRGFSPNNRRDGFRGSRWKARIGFIYAV